MRVISVIAACLTFAIVLSVACDDGARPRGAEAPLSAGQSTDARGGVLTFSITGSIWHVNADGGDVAIVVTRPVLESAYTSPTFSPDGSQMAYILNDRELLIADTDTAADAATRIDLYTDLSVANAASDWSMGPRAVHWSPDGEWLLVTRQRCCGSGSADVMLVRPDGSERRTIIESSRLPSFPEATWSESTAPAPGPPSIVVVGGDDGLSGLSYDIHGREVSVALPLTSTRFGVASHGNPYGEGTLVTSALGNPEPFGPIEVIDISGQSTIVGHGCGGSWSPDGRHIAYYDGYGIVVQAIGASPGDAVRIARNSSLFIDEPERPHEEACTGFAIVWR